MWWLYQALYGVLLLGAGPLALLGRGRHYLPTLSGRLGRGLGRRIGAAERGGLWIHAVSVGEAAVATTLARALPPALPLVVTTVTPTGEERARRALAGRAGVAYLPFELSFAQRRFFAAAEPRALVLVEGDYWPLLLREARRRGLPVAVVNGRISDRSFPRLAALRRLVGPLLLEPVDRFGVQTALDRDRLVALGVPPAKIAVTGNLKFEAPPPAPLPALARRITALAGGRPILLAGSTMPGEEERVLDAFAAAGGDRVALLVLAPRHPERFGAVAELLRARLPGALRRSDLDAAGANDAPPALLLDSLGELAALYELAHAAFVGGTLVAKGGHNPIEPARWGVPVAAGRHMENFAEIAASFDRASAWARVRDAGELAEVWSRWLLDPAEAAETGRRGRDLVEANRGALERTLALLAPLLDRIAAREGA
jgi:3-deoxy-D-manno-octulosonic-acid transferase